MEISLVSEGNPSACSLVVIHRKLLTRKSVLATYDGSNLWSVIVFTSMGEAFAGHGDDPSQMK